MATVAVVVSAGPGRADGALACPLTIDWWPDAGTTVPTNFRILFTLDSLDAPRNRAFLSKPLPTLVSDDHEVPLRVVRTFHDLAWQVLLEPTKPLAPNTHYQLHMAADSDMMEAITKASFSGDAEPLPAWRTGDGPDTSPPRWSARPRAIGVAQDRPDFVCATYNYRKYRTAIVDENEPLLIRVDAITDTGTRTHFVTSRRIVELGHGPCDFGSLPSRTQRVRFSAIDAAGNEAVAPGGDLAYEFPEWEGPNRPLASLVGWYLLFPFALGFLVVGTWMFVRYRRRA